MYRKLIPGRAAWPLATTTAAALLAGIVISGCGDSSGGAATTLSAGAATTSTAPASSPAAATSPAGAFTTASGSGTCNQWPGVGDLNAIALPLRQLASDEEIYGPGSDQANSGEMALSIAQMGLSQIMTQLPYAWAEEIQNQVLSVGGASSPAQLDTAAGNAWSLATDISQLCYTP